MTAPLDVSGSASEAQPEVVLSGAGRAVQGRSLTGIAWMRLRRDKIALAGGITVVLLILVAVFATPIIAVFGHPPLEFHQDMIDSSTLLPKGDFGGMGSEYLLGVEPVNGRDIFSRIVAGAGVSLLIGFLATLMDVFLAFPLLVFAIALAGVVPDKGFGLEGNGLRIAMLIFIIGFFSWPSIGRIVRGQTLSLREREFVDAARSLGARNGYILFREILPNLIAPILVYATLLIPANILFEAALSFLGVGINPPTPTWGGMLSEAVRFYTLPHFVIFPGLAIFITVLAFNLFGDGLRDAFDPRAH
jgi:ABC-type dipeptide/oligopeptide/nickel transport system permease subunit